jgi:hypothetical protein
MHFQITEQFIQRYLESFIELYGANNMIPSQHLSQHLVECLWEFGPVHGWWAFPFERYNGILQKQNTNHWLGRCTFTDSVPSLTLQCPCLTQLAGEMETTFTRAFCRAGNLKALFANERSNWPGIIKEFRQPLAQHYGSDLRGTLTNDLASLGLRDTRFADTTDVANLADHDLIDNLYDFLLQRLNIMHAGAFKSYKSSASGYALNPSVHY